MQPARGRFARFDLDRQMASTFPAHWKAWTSGRIPTKWSLSLPPGGRDCWLPHDSGAGLCWQHVGGVGSTTTTAFHNLGISLLEFTLFADDTNIIYSHDSTTSLCNTLNAELKNLSAWLNLNKLSLHLHETNHITFSTNNSDSTIQIAINGSNI